jgi:hypothetical protein
MAEKARSGTFQFGPVEASRRDAETSQAALTTDMELTHAQGCQWHYH